MTFRLGRYEIPRGAWIVVVAISFHHTAVAAPKKWSTYPNSFAIKPSGPRVPEPAHQIPQDPNLKWELTSEINGKEIGEDGRVPAYHYTKATGASFIGTVNSGVEIKLEKVTVIGRSLFYALPDPQGFQPRAARKKAKEKIPKVVWIPGRHIKNKK